MKRYSIPSCATLILFFVAATATYGLAAGPIGDTFEITTRGLAEPYRQSSAPGAFLPNSIVPTWDGGYLVSRTLEVERADTPNVTLYDSAGEKAAEAHIWFPDAAYVILGEARVALGGGILATGHADGAGTAFIAETGPDGRMTNVIKTSPFIAVFMCSRPDGSVWALGHEIGKEEVHEDYTMLRQYSFTKGLLRALLPRSSFQKSLGFIDEQTFLGCSSSSVLAYSGANGQLLRVATGASDSGALEAWNVDATAISGWRFTGFAATSSGHVYASLQRQSRANGVVTQTDTALYELVAENVTKRLLKWSVVSGTAGTRHGMEVVRDGVYILFGTDGENLVFGTLQEPFTLFWAAPRYERTGNDVQNQDDGK